MTFRTRLGIVVLTVLVLGCVSPLMAQQKGQWLPGQFGLNAGVIPDPGITYANLALNYSADQLNGPAGNRIPGITGNYSFWVDENIFYYVPKHKFLGGYFMPYIALNYASGELVADFTGTNLSGAGGGSGFADMYVQPLNLGWHFGKRVDFNAGHGRGDFSCLWTGKTSDWQREGFRRRLQTWIKPRVPDRLAAFSGNENLGAEWAQNPAQVSRNQG